MQSSTPPTGRLRLYDYAASANSYKVRLLLAQLEQPYERIPVDIFAGETLGAEYAALNPAREVPVLQSEDGRFLPDSSAILAYLADSTPFLPAGVFERADVLRWLMYEQTVVIPAVGGLRFRLQTGRLLPSDDEARRRALAGQAVLALLDRQLAARPFLVGDQYSIADIALYGYLHVAGEAGFDLDAHANLGAWLERVRAQPLHMNDLEPYPPNSWPGAGRSIYA